MEARPSANFSARLPSALPVSLSPISSLGRGLFCLLLLQSLATEFLPIPLLLSRGSFSCWIGVPPLLLPSDLV